SASANWSVTTATLNLIDPYSFEKHSGVLPRSSSSGNPEVTVDPNQGAILMNTLAANWMPGVYMFRIKGTSQFGDVQHVSDVLTVIMYPAGWQVGDPMPPTYG